MLYTTTAVSKERLQKLRERRRMLDQTYETNSEKKKK